MFAESRTILNRFSNSSKKFYSLTKSKYSRLCISSKENIAYLNHSSGINSFKLDKKENSIEKFGEYESLYLQETVNEISIHGDFLAI